MADSSDWKVKALTRQNEKQEMYHRWKIFSVEEEDFMRTEIGILLFGQVEITDETHLPAFNHYHTLYDSTKRETIETIITKIRTKIPPPRNVAFGFTFLTARVHGCDDIQEFVIFRCASENLRNVFFIEPSGRVYEDWRDFINSNKLPNCKYLAPNDGVYKLEGDICIYTSPEANKSFAGRYADRVVTVAGLGVIGAGIFSVASAGVVVAGVAVGAYSVCQSAANLYDRYRHSESIRPDNMEAISNHLTIATVGLTGASSAALAWRQQITSKCGRWAPALLRSMNIGVLCLDAVGMGFNSWVFYEKYNTSELTCMDVFNMMLQVYLLHGQLSNTMEVHKMLSSSNTAAPARLTKSQKRNMRRRRAKAAKRGQVLSPSTVRVTESSSNTFDSVKLMARFMGGNVVAFLRKHYPREQVIVEFLTDLKNLISSLWNGRISSKDFLLNLVSHIRNLAQILMNDVESLRRYSSLLDMEPDVNAVGSTYNGIQRVNDSEDSISEELDHMIDQIPGRLAEPSAPESDLANVESSSVPAAEDDGIMKRIDVDVILSAVKTLIGRCLVHQNSAIMLVFGEGIKYIRSEVVTKLLEKYELAFSANIALLNDAEMVAKALAFLGIKIGNHFFPARAELEEVLSEAVEKVEKFVDAAEYAVGIQDEECEVDKRINAVVTQISDSIATFFRLLVAPETETGLQQTLDILEYVSNFYVTEKVVEFDRQRTAADQLYETNVGILGSRKAEQLLAGLGMSIDPLEIASKCATAELNDAQLDHLLEYHCSITPLEPNAEDKTVGSSTEDSNFEDCFLITLTMTTCSVFMQKIRPLDCATKDPQILFEKVVRFVLTRFARDTSNSIEQFQQLKSNLDILGPAKYEVFLKNLKACPQKNRDTLQRAAELLMAFEDDVVLEYFELFPTDDQLENVKLWQSEADEEGLQVKSTKNCCINLSDLEFRDLAMSLFRVRIDQKFSVEKHKNSVFLRSEKYIITFSLDEESGSWLVILADQRVNQNEV